MLADMQHRMRLRGAWLVISALLLMATMVSTEQSLSPFRRLLRLLSSAATSDDPLSPESGLLSPLWNVADYDFVGPTASRYTSRALLSHDDQDASDPDPDPQPSPSHRPLRNEDFVYVAPSNAQRLPLAQASRYWRKGMRAAFVMDTPAEELPHEVLTNAAKYHESLAWYPNFRRMANGKRDHYLEGDRRAAMAPMLAYAVLANPAALAPYTNARNSSGSGTIAATSMQQAVTGSAAAAVDAPEAGAAAQKDPFQWMLMGDDDTVWFMRGVKALLRDYDPQLPYFITDSMYVGHLSPNPGVWEMRCYPCHLPDSWGRWRRAAARRLMASDGAGGGGRAEAVAPKGCSCSTESLCKRRFPGNETRCQKEWEGPVPFGGVGFIFSIGFFKQLAALQNGKGLRAYETCINAPETSVMSFPEGGDAFMSRCLWRLGFPVTDPGYTPLGRYMGEILSLKDLYEAPANLTRGELPTQALTRWSTAVSLHLGARQQKSFRATALTVKYISGVYDLVGELLWPTAGRKSDL